MSSSMTDAKYDDAVEFYSSFVRRSLASPTSVLSVTTQGVFNLLGDVKNLKICDVACGEGHLSRRLAEQGASVIGIDISKGLLECAREQSNAELDIAFRKDDAQVLKTIPEQDFDLAVSNLALMDIPDHKKVFGACHRILKQGGALVFSVLHPCFESPFNQHNPPIELNGKGEFLACRVHSYLEEGFWKSDGDGVRGRVGAYHRTLSTYLNDLLYSGFRLSHIEEVSLPKKNYSKMEEQWFSHIPKGLVVKAYKGQVNVLPGI